jgi:hypothetical protein
MLVESRNHFQGDERYGPWPKKHMNLCLSSPGWVIIAPTWCRTLERILNDIWIGPNVFFLRSFAVSWARHLVHGYWNLVACQHDTTFNLTVLGSEKGLPNIRILCLWYTELWATSKNVDLHFIFYTFSNKPQFQVPIKSKHGCTCFAKIGPPRKLSLRSPKLNGLKLSLNLSEEFHPNPWAVDLQFHAP